MPTEVTTTTTGDIRRAAAAVVHARTDLRQVKEILDVTRAPNMRQNKGFQVLADQYNDNLLRDKPGRVTMVRSDLEFIIARRLNPGDHEATLEEDDADVDAIRAWMIGDFRPPMQVTHLNWVEVSKPILHSRGEWMFRRLVMRFFWQLGIEEHA